VLLDRGDFLYPRRAPHKFTPRDVPGSIRGNAGPLGWAAESLERGRAASGEGGIDVLRALAGVAEHSLRCRWASPKRQRDRPTQLYAGIVLPPGHRRYTTKVPLRRFPGCLVCRRSIQRADALDRRGARAGEGRVRANRPRHAVGAAAHDLLPAVHAGLRNEWVQPLTLPRALARRGRSIPGNERG
jgi:hypothetical protein